MLAALTLVVGWTWMWFWLGKAATPALAQLRRVGINPSRYTELEQLVLDLTAEPSSLDPSQIVVLPAPLAARAVRLREQVTVDRQRAIAAERGRRSRPWY